MSIIPDIESPQLTSELLLEFIIDEVEVKSKLQSLYTDRSSGPNGISVQLQLQFRNYSCNCTLMPFYNKSFAEGYAPEK